jgi:ketosteroid isomerase-like protein
VSDPREELVRDIYARWNQGDRGLDPEQIHPDAVVYSAMTGDTFRGLDGVRRWMAEIDEQFDDWLLKIEQVRDVDDNRLLLLGAVHFRGRASGVEFDQPMGWLIEFEAARITAL